MAARSFLVLSLMVLGDTMVSGSFWNLWGSGEPLTANLRQSITYDCSSTGAQSCLDCFNFPYCTQIGKTAFNITCKNGKVCQMQNGVGSCVLFSDTTKVTDCVCGSNGIIDDPYEISGNKYLKCVTGQLPEAHQCPAGEAFSLSTSSCVTAPPPPDCSQGAGFYLYGCLGAYFCPWPGAQPNEVNIVTCPAGKLFDINLSKCVSQEQVQLGPFACSATLEGAIADTIECNAFYVCMFGEQQGDKICCPTGESFSQSLMTCTTDLAQVTCPEKHPCDTHTYDLTCAAPTTLASSTTTSTPSTTTSTSSTTTSTPSTTKSIPSTTTTTPSTTPLSSTTTTPTSTTTTTSTTITPSTTTTTTPTTTTTQPTTTTTTSTTTTTTTPATTTTAKACGVLPSCATDGAFSYSCSCTKYFWCAGGKATVQNCPSQLRFSPTLKYCTTADQVPVCA